MKTPFDQKYYDQLKQEADLDRQQHDASLKQITFSAQQAKQTGDPQFAKWGLVADDQADFPSAPHADLDPPMESGVHIPNWKAEYKNASYN